MRSRGRTEQLRTALKRAACLALGILLASCGGDDEDCPEGGCAQECDSADCALDCPGGACQQDCTGSSGGAASQVEQRMGFAEYSYVPSGCPYTPPNPGYGGGLGCY